MKRNVIGASALVLLAIAAGLMTFPKEWNAVMVTMKEKVGFHLPYIPERDFTLGLDLKGGAHLVYEADMTSVDSAERDIALEGVRDVIERRVNAFGVAEPIVQTNVSDGHYRVLVDLPGVTDVQSAISQIGETPVLAFRTPIEDVNTTPTEEQQMQIDAAQVDERKNALAIMDKALAGEDFAALALENSIDGSTKANGGYIGFVTADDKEYDGLVEQIESKRLKVGVINGLYEGTSRMHVVKYISRKTESEPRISHILICYSGATGCAQTRTKEEALTFAQQLKSEATTQNFADLAKANSDDPGSGKNGGDLDYVARGQMVQAFEDAAYNLRDTNISDVIETEFGYHILYRVGSRPSRSYEIAHIEMPWTTASDVLTVDPWKNTELSGKDLKHASVAFDPNSGAPLVILQFNENGTALFSELTKNNVGKIIGIFLDGEAITTPVVNEPIYGGEATISGNFTIAEAKLLAQRLNAGALPVPIAVVSQQTIGPALGAESLDLSIKAGLIGFLLVALFMVLYYRLAGVVAIVSLAVYGILNLALFKTFGVTITLSGIAGFIFSLGIAVDANVLIFERMKEELRSGRDLPSAVEEAFRRAWPSIRDGNTTTLIATGILFELTSGSIRGFALTLALGVFVSLFCAFVVCRFILRRIARMQKVRSKFFFLGL
ncbi:MAG: protein translocase subunit SecD [Patescibacteria group bacterium]|jgi:protein-export membrane protein SecD